MNAIKYVLAAGLATVASAPALAEDCMSASTGADGTPRYTHIDVDLGSRARLDPAALPERTSAIMCRRPSIIPRPDDIRVLSEWRVAFGIAEQGPRVLWISVDAGIVQVSVEHGALRVNERSAVNQWRQQAQLRFVLEVARHP